MSKSETKERNGCLEGIGFLTLATPAVIASVLIGFTVKALVLTMLWQWFITPLFGLDTLSIPYAVGLTLVSAILTQGYDPGKASEGKGCLEQVGDLAISLFLWPGIILLVGYIASLFAGG